MPCRVGIFVNPSLSTFLRMVIVGFFGRLSSSVGGPHKNRLYRSLCPVYWPLTQQIHAFHILQDQIKTNTVTQNDLFYIMMSLQLGFTAQFKMFLSSLINKGFGVHSTQNLKSILSSLRQSLIGSILFLRDNQRRMDPFSGFVALASPIGCSELS